MPSPMLRPLLGVDRPELRAALTEATALLAPSGSGGARSHGMAALESRALLAELLSERAPGDGAKLLFAASGAMALDSATRMARALTRQTLVVRSDGTIGDLLQILKGDEAEQIAAIIVDSGAVDEPAVRDLHEFAHVLSERGILLIADETVGGFARTGHWFASEAFGVVPDLTVFGEDLDSGLVGIGGIVVAARSAERLTSEYYCGIFADELHPLAAAVAVASIATIESQGLLDRVTAMGRDVIRPTTADWSERHTFVRAVVGSGLRWRIEFTSAHDAAIAEFVGASRREGIWPSVIGQTALFAPSITIADTALREGLGSIDAALTLADRLFIRSTPARAA